MMVGKNGRDFDRQADSYDRRAGLPAAARAGVAAELVGMARLGPADLVVEIGAGTGQVGRALCAVPVRYLGIDLSPLMLARFAEWGRRHGCATPLVLADASRQWPLPDGAAKLIFGSRSLHLLPLPHLVAEASRVARAYVVIGRVVRGADGLRATIRREMHTMLIQRGYVPNDADLHATRLIDSFAGLGARAMAPRVVAVWEVRRTVKEMIGGWREVDGLAGVNLSPEEKDAVLTDLAAFATRQFRSLDVAETSEERYMLAGVELDRRAVAEVAT
jgi:hypothetical protein